MICRANTIIFNFQFLILNSSWRFGYPCTKIKSPRSCCPRDEKNFRGTTLLISPRGEITHRAPTSPIPVTGETGSHYSPSLSQDRLGNQIAISYRTGSHQPPALWSIKDKASFPSMSFNISVCILKHTDFTLSIVTSLKNDSCHIYTKRGGYGGRFFDKKTFDFHPWTW